jgi:valyl-tRNA synthetase
MYEPKKYPDGTLQSAQWTLTHALTDVLTLFAPFIPHATDSVYQYCIAKDLEQSIHNKSWPTQYKAKEEYVLAGKKIHELLGATRRYKAGKNLPLNTSIEPSMIIGCTIEEEKLLTPFTEIMSGTVQAAMVRFARKEEMTQPSFEVATLSVIAPLAVKDKKE